MSQQTSVIVDPITSKISELFAHCSGLCTSSIFKSGFGDSLFLLLMKNKLVGFDSLGAALTACLKKIPLSSRAASRIIMGQNTKIRDIILRKMLTAR